MPLIWWHAQHFGDDCGGQGQGIVTNQIYLAFPFGGGQQLAGQAGYTVAHGLHEARRERLMNQAAQPGVVGRVNVQHVAGKRRKNFGTHSCFFF
jgi:hypothetical protein